MFKVFIIIFIALWIFVKLGGFFVKLFFGGLTNNQTRQQSGQNQQRTRQPSDGNVNIDYNPKSKQEVKGKDFKGGDYVDYEEV